MTDKTPPKKNALILLLVMLFALVCVTTFTFQHSNTLSSTTEKKESNATGIISDKKIDFEICHSSGKDCIRASSALHEVYKSLDSVENFGVIKGVGIASVVRALSFKDKTDEYTIFLIQMNELSSNGYGERTISTCHACPAALGMVIYQYHNDWKLFAENGDVTVSGSFGKAFNGSSIAKAPDVDIQSVGTENFYLLLRNTDGGQGYFTENATVIKVAGNSSVENSKIESLGIIELAQKDCSDHDSAEKENDWFSSDVKVVPNSAPLKITFVKNERAICDHDAPILSSSPQTYLYDWRSKKFVLQ